MASPNSRDTLIEYAKRKLGDPVIEINVDEDQAEDRLDEALQLYQEYHSDATIKTYFKHLVTETDVTNEYIPITSDIIYIARLFPIFTSSASRNFFDIKYQLMLNDMWDLNSVVGGIAYYEQTQQYLSMLDMKLNGTPQVSFARKQNRLYIHGDFADKDIKAGDYLVAEVYQTLDPDTHTSIYNDIFMKDYTTALIKQQWGANLIKFEGMQLPGGVTLNGREIYSDATQEIQQLKENLRLEQELPPSFYVG